MRGFKCYLGRVKKAFTLIELMVLIAVLAIVGVMMWRISSTIFKTSRYGEVSEELIKGVQSAIYALKRDIRRGVRVDLKEEVVKRIDDADYKITFMDKGDLKEVEWYVDEKEKALVRKEKVGRATVYLKGYVKNKDWFMIDPYFLKDKKFYRIYLKVLATRSESAKKETDFEIVTSVFSRNEKERLEDKEWVKF